VLIALISGHIAALLPECLRAQIHRTVFMAVNNANWQHVPSEIRELARQQWLEAIDTIKEEGYFPPSASIFGCTLPAGCGMEWTEAISGDDKRYYAGNPKVAHFYTSWEPTNEIISLVFSDDVTIFGQSEPTAVDAWCAVHTRAKITRVMVSPKDYGTSAVGHVGMFREGQIRLWEVIGDIILYGRLPKKGRFRRWNLGKVRL